MGELDNLVEKQDTIVSLHEEGNMKNMYDNGSYFFNIHVYLQTPNPWEDENTSLAYEDCKMEDKCEGHEFTANFSVSDHNISAKEGYVVNGDKEYFGSDPK